LIDISDEVKQALHSDGFANRNNIEEDLNCSLIFGSEQSKNLVILPGKAI
jgi:hypothetical protein